MKDNNFKRKLLHSFQKNWQLYVFMLPAILYILFFAYKPMYGILIAFEDFSIRKGIMGSEWVGFEHFERLFSSYWFPITLKNTLVLSFLNLFMGFPIAIILALFFNEVRNARYRKMVQTVSYAPHFISTVVMCSIIFLMLDPRTGVVNKVLNVLGMESVNFMNRPELFKWVYSLTNIWQGVGWSSIIYFAALSSLDKSLLEAAEIDGASRIQRIWYINIPTIIPTIMVTFILQCGQVLSIGYEKILLLQTDVNITASEVISSYVYKVGLEQADYSFSTAAGLFNTVVNCVFLIAANKISKKVTDSGLF